MQTRSVRSRLAAGLCCLAVSSLAAACSREPAPPATATHGSASTAASTDCPDAIKQSIAKSFAGGTITKCKAEHEDGHDQYEVKVDQAGQRLEVDVAPDGTVLQTESSIGLDGVPPTVMSAFGAKYPGAKPNGAEKQVRSGKGTYYEIAFGVGSGGKEATFAEDGTFVEEE